MAALINPAPSFSPIGVTSCDREPIHIPGSVQPHAVLLVLEEPSLTIRQASANAAVLLGGPLEKILGSPVRAFLPADAWRVLKKTRADESGDFAPRYLPAWRLGPADTSVEVTIHRYKGALILELESSLRPDLIEDRELLSAVRGMLSFSTNRESIPDFCRQTAEDMRKFTGFDRVMVYRFDPDLSGHVIAESKRDDLESYLGLHYPASDIPKPARELLCLSKLRLIPDVGFRSVPLFPVGRADNRQPLDMSYCVSRATSPIHIEYLQNMGVGATMSLSIVIENKLWGLFACHHYSPRYVPHATRSACDFLAHALAILVAGREQAAELSYSELLDEKQRLLNRAISDNSDFEAAVREMPDPTIGGIRAAGAALVINGVACLKGQTPDAAAVVQLADFCWEHIPDPVWETDRLPEAMPLAAKLVPGVCGILGARLSGDQRSCLFWFRPEYAHTVKWAGNPAQSKGVDPGGIRLTPRKSFALWQQEVSGRSRFWMKNEIAAARAIRQSFFELYPVPTQGLVVLNANLTGEVNALRASMEAKDEFLATLSHELRTPLNPALLLASEEAGNLALRPETRAGFLAIRENVELAARLIDDLLDLSRIAHGKIVLERKSLGLHVALFQALAIMESEFAGKEVRLTVRLSAVEATVDADIVRLLQVFWNVLKNAIKFTPRHGTVTVESQIHEARRKAIVRISDTGIGMSAEELPRIFEAFSQGDHAAKGGPKKFGGLGLGLAITRSLLHAHDGKISVESAGRGRGATFTIELPLSTAVPVLNPAGEPQARLPALPTGPAPVHANAQGEILLVEDHAATRAAMALILGRRGYAVAQAASFKEARALVSGRDFALIISDIGLPDGDGYTFMRELIKARPATKAVALSGRGMTRDRTEALSAGFAELIVKPINVHELEAVIARMLPASARTQRTK